MKHHSPTNYAQAFIRAQHGKLDKEKEALFNRLIAMMRDNDDEKKIKATLRTIHHLLSDEKNRSAVRVVTSIALNAHEKSTLQKQFPADTHAWEINPEILGGMVVEQGTRLYQMSLRHLLKGFER